MIFSLPSWKPERFEFDWAIVRRAVRLSKNGVTGNAMLVVSQ
jgi:hypothetical protein